MSTKFYVYDRHMAENYICVSLKPIGDYSDIHYGNMQEFIDEQVDHYGFDVSLHNNVYTLD